MHKSTSPEHQRPSELVSVHKWPFSRRAAFSAGFRLRRTAVRLAENLCAALLDEEIAHFWIGQAIYRSFMIHGWTLITGTGVLDTGWSG
jgi:hypothetical protein